MASRGNFWEREASMELTAVQRAFLDANLDSKDTRIYGTQVRKGGRTEWAHLFLGHLDFCTQGTMYCFDCGKRTALADGIAGPLSQCSECGSAEGTIRLFDNQGDPSCDRDYPPSP